MSDVVKINIRRCIAKAGQEASREISKYTAIFIAADNALGSGTFVYADGVFGILTAYHVAESVCNVENLALCLNNTPHRLVEINRALIQRLKVGPVQINRNEEDGPDMDFLIIKEGSSLDKVRRHKSFFALNSADQTCFKRDIDKMLWSIGGTYEDSSKPKYYQNGTSTRVVNFVGTGELESRSIENGFDYVTIRLPAGSCGFPCNYAGISGGGFWLTPFSGFDQHREPIFGSSVLAGVEFWQSERASGERILKGHGFDSIYYCLRKALENWYASS